MSSQDSDRLHQRWAIRGQVQGVGFRPFVYRLATAHALRGWVRNDTGGVTIEAWGGAAALDAFDCDLRTSLPPLARVDHVDRRTIEPAGEWPNGFRIVASESTTAERGRVTVDSATCADCWHELFDAADRRYRHGLINCTNCGPRFTIVRDLPYDRIATTMAGFSMCARCAGEYADPGDRRFHAQPICCHECGPQVSLRMADGRLIGGDAIVEAARLLKAGLIVAIKGLGGYHLAVRAVDEIGVRELRRRKKRDFKPFALMARDLTEARRLVELSPGAEAELTSPAAPIVLARAHEGNGLAPGVAPGSHRLGVMLPSTPMQHLLMAEDLGPLVMTSANVSDEPLVKDDDEPDRRLAGVHDAVLWHDRPIERAVDDSVLLDGADGPVMLRRARGYVPAPVMMPVRTTGPGLCVGGELKNTIALVDENLCVLSQHVGDLSQMLAYTRFVRTIEDMQRLFDVEPAWVACDRHPGYLSCRFAKKLSKERGLRLIETQHHHAHAASLLVEHGRTGPIVAIVCDGVGYGDDGTAWGGEILKADLRGFERLSHLRPLRLPGGDAAAKRTGRCALSWLVDRFGPAGLEHPLVERVLPDSAERQAVGLLLRRDLNCPVSSGTGRLFDAAASLLGVCDFNHHESMSGQMLESAAFGAAQRPDLEVSLWSPYEGLPRAGRAGLIGQIDHRPLLDRLIEGLLGGEQAGALAWLFHDALARGLAEAAAAGCRSTGLQTIGLTGGVFCNELLTRRVLAWLSTTGLEVIRHVRIPPNDGGLALGQAGIGATIVREV
ncbi:MAG: carbamoyltransferase HypF [Leptolyngbya sp. PLA3]|nr:MAG: carbamoyltransferase HypF [Cyanobacteria bacterium CYA]MCE7967773.1 carbamoyltransferase HypF [Leptolyngbya sp. PL-A3]